MGFKMTNNTKYLVLIFFVFLSSEMLSNNHPTISNFRIENTNKNRIYFDSSEPITATNSVGFYLSDNRRKKITGVSINESSLTGHYFTVDSNFDYWDTYAIRYEGGSNFEDLDNNPLHEFWLYEVVNKIPEPAPSGTPYWVRTTGSDSADGLSHATAFKTINKAMSLNANTIYIEVGDYGAEQLDFNYNGTATNPIIVQGYKTETGGVPDEITSNYWSWGSYGTGTNVTVDTSEMPTITGNTTLRHTNYETAITPSDYIIIKNIQVINWNIGFNIRSRHHMTLKNVTTVYTGNASSGIGAGVYVVGGSGSDNATYNKFIDMQIAQCAVVGIRQYGGGALFDNVNVNADRAFGEGYDTPDYYISIYHGSNNVIKNCSVAEIGSDIGSSHGIGFKTGSTPHANCTEYNLVTDCTARNMQGGIELRHEDVANTVVRNINIFSLPEDGAISAVGNGSVGIVVRDGSHHNNFENITIDSQNRAIYFTDTVEQGDQTNGHDCTFNNLVISNCAIFLATNGKTGEVQAYNNHFYNLTIDGIFDEMYWSNGSIVIMGNNNSLTNSSISNCTSSVGNTSIVQSHNNYHNNSFATPSGTNITTHPPLFTDAANGDFTLQATSLLKNIGIVTSNKYDINEIERLSGSVNLGAYEDTAPRIGSVSPSSVTVCDGESVTLVASGGTSYSWNTGETSDSITVSPSSTTTYTVTISDGTNSDSHDVIVTVNEAPTVDAGSDLTICYGESVTLIATGIGDFLWSTGETTSSITVNPTTTTTYSITSSNSCSTNATDQVIVNVNEQVIANAGNDISINEGDSVTLTANGGDTYLWSNGATTQDITISPTSTTTYTVAATTNGCTDSDTVQVTVNPVTGSVTANAGADQDICLGDSVTLTASGGSSYSWSNGATTQSITVSPTTTNTYTVTVSDGSTSDSDDVIVTVNSVTANAGSDVSITEGDNATLTATGGTGYLWNTGETTQSITVNPSSTTTYSVTVSSDGCADVDSVIVTVNPSTGSVTANAGADQNICFGDNVTLTASGGSSYSWSNGATTQSITVSPTNTTTYTVTASDGSTTDTDDVIVTVNSVTADAGSDVSITEGDNVTLTATGGTGYLWNTGATTQSVTVNPSSTTTYSVTVSSDGCTDVDSVIVTVNPSTGSVTANAGADQDICLGDSVTLTASGGSSYSWSNGATSQSITVSPTNTTTYTVTASDGSATDSDDVIVTVNSVTASLGSNRTINNGDNVKLTATGGDSYIWSTGETSNSITVSPQETSIYSVTAFKGGCEDTDNVQVTVIINDDSLPLPAVADAGEDETICLGENVTLKGKGGDSYLWSNGDSSKNINVSPTRTTVYVLSATSGGITTTDEIIVTVENCSNSDSEDLVSSTLNIYPNPSRDVVNISLDNSSDDFNLLLVDLKGAILYNDHIQNYQNSINTQIDMSRFAKGIYLIRLENNTELFVEKLIHI